MAETSPFTTLPTTVPPSILNKAHFQQIRERVADLDGSQAELLSNMQRLKQEVQKWKLNLDEQAKAYREELLELKKDLRSDVNQLKSEVKEMKTTLHVRQSSWGFNLWNFGMKDASENGHQESSYDSVKETKENKEPPNALDSKEFKA